MRRSIVLLGMIIFLSMYIHLFGEDTYDKLILGTEGLVGYWKLNEEDSTFVNSLRNNYTGTDEGKRIMEMSLKDKTSGIKIYQDTTYPEPYTSADNFYGNHYIRIWRHGDDFDMRTGDFSLEAWIKVSRIPVTAVPIVGKSSPFSKSYGLYLTRTMSISMTIWENRSNYNTATTPPGSIKPGEWYHVVGVRRGDTLRIYLNGVLKGESTRGFDIDTGEYGNLHFGGFRLGRRFIGKMRNIALYRRALGSEEIKKHFESGRKQFSRGGNL